MLRVLSGCALLSAALAVSAQVPARITTDPSPGQTPASMQSFQIPSHGSGLNALMYLAPGERIELAETVLNGLAYLTNK